MRCHAMIPVLLLALVAAPGCAVALGAGAGLATVKYLNNQVSQDYATTLRGAYDAALAALPELGYPAPSRATLGPTEARIAAGDADVAIAQHPQGRVRVAVSVGTLQTGDHRRRAQLILERIGQRLAGAQPPR